MCIIAHYLTFHDGYFTDMFVSIGAFNQYYTGRITYVTGFMIMYACINLLFRWLIRYHREQQHMFLSNVGFI